MMYRLIGFLLAVAIEIALIVTGLYLSLTDKNDKDDVKSNSEATFLGYIVLAIGVCNFLFIL